MSFRACASRATEGNDEAEYVDDQISDEVATLRASGLHMSARDGFSTSDFWLLVDSYATFDCGL